MIGVGQRSGASRAVDIGAAGIFAGAAGYSALLATAAAGPASAVAAAGFIAAAATMARISDASSFPLPGFALQPIEVEEDDALLLTELAELLLSEVAVDGNELLLEDRLDSPTSDSRVIRLFDPKSLPTAGELQERIEDHLRNARARAYPDATAELHRALSDLRQSLR